MASSPARVRTSEILIIAGERRVVCRGREVPLTAREYEVLAALAERPGWVYSAEQLAGDDPTRYTSPYAVNVHITHIRAKLRDAGAPDGVIETVRGAGWRLRKEPVSGDNVGCLIAEARVASTRKEFAQAVVLLGRALHLLDGSGMERARASRVRAVIHERRGAAHAALSEWGAARQDYVAAIEERSSQDLPALARLNTRLGVACTFERNRGEGSRAFAAALGALDSLEERDERWWVSWIEVRLKQLDAAYITDLPNGPTDPEGELGEAVERHGTLKQKSEYLMALGTHEYANGRYTVSDRCLERQRAALSLAERSESHYIHALAASLLGSYLVQRRQFGEAEARLREAIDLCRRCQDVMGEQAGQWFLSLCGRLSGNVRSTATVTDSLEGLLDQRASLPEFVSGVKGQRAWIALRRGEYASAEALAEQALSEWERDPSCSQMVWVMAWPAVSCALHKRDLARAVECAVLMTRTDQQVLDGDLDARLRDAAACFAHGDRERATSLLREAESEARAYGYA